MKHLLPALTLFAGSAVLAGGSGYSIVHSTISAGGGVSDGAVYRLTGTIAQWDAAEEAMAGAVELAGGFWAPGEAALCAADLNGSGAVDSGDLAILLAGWGGSGAADLNGSGNVGSGDLAILLAAWGVCL